MGYCEGVQDWFMCLKCEHLCSFECPIQRGDIEDLIRQFNMLEASRTNHLIGGLGDTVGNA